MKIGRNELCPCGSGRKYKHCCLANDQAERHTSATLPGGSFIAEINPEVEEAVNQAIELAQKGKIGPARVAMDRLLAANPANHGVFFGMGVLHCIQNEHKESMIWFDQATAIYPYFMEAHFNKATACKMVFDVAGAIRSSRKVVEVGDPKEREVKQAKKFLTDMADAISKNEGVDLDAYLASQDAFNQAFDLMEKGAWEKALAGFRAAAEKNDRNAPTHGNLGLCLARLGHKSAALKELDRAIEIDSDYEPAKSNRLAVEQMQEGVPLMAIDEFRRIEFSKEQILHEREGGSWQRRLCEMFGSDKKRL